MAKRSFEIGILAAAFALLLAVPHAQAAGLAPSEAALRVNQLFAGEVDSAGSAGNAPVAASDPAAALSALEAGKLPPRADDETFLRRVSLDLIGQLPTPEEITAFVLDTAVDKRTRVVDRLLADPRYGQNWGRYWRDVMLYRRGDERALLAAESGAQFLADQFNRDVPWNEIARSLLTATGNVSENGSTILLASQWGQVPETAAEAARVLMGVQIQCAQCHDHKTDRWKRAQFHELAAFFPRVSIQRVTVPGEKRREFEVASKGEARLNPGKAKAKGKAKPKDKPKAKDKAKAEKKAAKQRLEYYMPDLKDPAAQGTLMSPVFFITGQKLDEGASDHERRETLARWMTAEENPWFAKAIVNRLWGELIGQGFYEPIDDLGPDRQCTAPQTLDLLTSQFIAHDYDLKWLFRTITATQLYERESRPRPQAGEKMAAAVCPQPLRADQLFNALTTALGIDEAAADAKAAQKAPGPQRALRTPRGLFAQAFGYDPSAPRDEPSGSIAQALLLMNSPPLAQAIAANTARGAAQGAALGDVLAKAGNDDDAIVELYLRCLAREPREGELKACREYLADVKNRHQAFEDILWALVNSTEFLYRQ